jgi:hypothetical protein
MTTDQITRHPGGGMTFTGRGVSVFQARVIAAGLRLYARTSIKPNSAYTPRNMMAAAARITGRKFAARDYLNAAEALDTWAKAAAAAIHQGTE